MSSNHPALRQPAERETPIAGRTHLSPLRRAVYVYQETTRKRHGVLLGIYTSTRAALTHHPEAKDYGA